MRPTCQHCQKELSYSGRGRPPTKYCSRKCKDAAKSATRRRVALAGAGERRCVICDVILPDTTMLDAKCCSPKCREIYSNRKRAAAKRAQVLAAREPCKRCGAEIPAERRSNSVYCSWECKKRVNDAAWRQRAPHYMRQYLYGISQEQYELMLAAQDGRCAICRTDDWPGKGNRPHVDHCHTTGRVRGILCGACNNGLGNFGDDPARLRAAADYLERAAAC